MRRLKTREDGVHLGSYCCAGRPILSRRLPGNAGSKSHLAGSAMRPICQGLDRFPKRAIPTYDVAAWLTRSLRRDLSREMICETFATEFFGSPVTRADKLTLPGASAHFKLLVSGTQMAVEMRL